jgi:DNA-binding transcriptional ArsR family regulator
VQVGQEECDPASAHERRTGTYVTAPIYQLKADFFKTLAHPARIRIIEILRDGEASVSELIPQVGLEPSHLSQQLGVLRRAGLVTSRKEGNTVRYSVTDPRLFQLLELAKRILTTSLEETSHLLAELEGIDFSAPGRKSRKPKQQA